MRWIALLLLVWSGVVVIGLLFIGPDLSTATGCLKLAGGPRECLQQLSAVNDERWQIQTAPRLVVATAGYLLILIYGIWALGARRRRVAW
jgi:hypothetical protein